MLRFTERDRIVGTSQLAANIGCNDIGRCRFTSGLWN